MGHMHTAMKLICPFDAMRWRTTSLSFCLSRGQQNFEFRVFFCKQSGRQRFFVAFQVASVMARCIKLQWPFCSLVNHTVAVCQSQDSDYVVFLRTFDKAGV